MAGARASIQGPKIGRIMAGLERAIIDGKRETIMKAALASKVVHESEIKSVAGSDGVLSGVGLKGARVGARFDMQGSTWDPESLIKATGPIQFIERDTRPHHIRSKRMSGSRKTRSSMGSYSGKVRKIIGPTLAPVISFPGPGGTLFRHSAYHPGTAGQHPWAKGKKKAQVVITKIIRTGTFNIVRKAAKA